MDQRTLEESRARLGRLRRDELAQLGVSLGAMSASLGLTTVYEPLVLPLFVGAVTVGALAIRSSWKHWDLLDRLSADRDAHVIHEVAAHARRHAQTNDGADVHDS